MPANTTRPRPRFADRSPQQQQVQHFSDILSPVGVLSHPQTPTQNDLFGQTNPVGRLSHQFAIDPTASHQSVPISTAKVVKQFIQSRSMFVNKPPIDHRTGFGILPLDHLLHDAFEQRDITVNFDLQKQISQFRGNP